MTTTTHDRPLFRVSCARITGKDAKGNDQLGRPKEIGAVWPRKGDKKGGIIALDLIPIELMQRDCVLFLVPVGEDGQ
ncbi:hypothetical protein STVA_28150 [Allostella vacuolata]|nr:hypothetical protein STVA_28150 [Stella vacuolata]